MATKKKKTSKKTIKRATGQPDFRNVRRLIQNLQELIGWQMSLLTDLAQQVDELASNDNKNG